MVLYCNPSDVNLIAHVFGRKVFPGTDDLSGTNWCEFGNRTPKRPGSGEERGKQVYEDLPSQWLLCRYASLT